MQTGSFTKDDDLYFLTMCPVTANIVGLTEYHPDMRWREEDLSQTGPAFAASVNDEDNWVVAHQKASNSTAIIVDLSANVFAQTTVYKHPLAVGGFQGIFSSIELAANYSGWPSLLNHDTEQLLLPNGTQLSRRDLCVLHQYLYCWPRKIIASNFNVSVKAIEKRLTRIRNQMEPADSTHYNLQGYLQELGIMPFLMAHPDWFALAASHTVHHK